MSKENPPAHAYQPAGPFAKFLEYVTAVVLVAVLIAMGWIVVVASRPDLLRLSSTTIELVVVIALLAAALILVGSVALLNTRPRRDAEG